MKSSPGRVTSRSVLWAGVKHNGSLNFHDINECRTVVDRSSAKLRHSQSKPGQLFFNNKELVNTASSIMLTNRSKIQDDNKQSEKNITQKPGFIDAKKIRSFISKIKFKKIEMENTEVGERATANVEGQEQNIRMHYTSSGHLHSQREKGRSNSGKKSLDRNNIHHHSQVLNTGETEKKKYYAGKWVSSHRGGEKHLFRDNSASQSVRGLREGVSQSKDFLNNITECLQQLENSSRRSTSNVRASGTESLANKLKRRENTQVSNYSELKAQNEALKQKIAKLKIKLKEETVCKEYWREKHEDLRSRYDELILLNVRSKNLKKSRDETETKQLYNTITRSTLESVIKPFYKK